MGDVFHGNLHDISDLIATFQSMLTQQQNAANNTGTTANNTGSTTTNTGNVNNKLLTATKTSQTIGFLGASSYQSAFTTASTTFVNTGLSVANVPNGAKVAYVYYLSNSNPTGFTATAQLIAGSTVLQTTGAITGSTFTEFMDYSGTVTQNSGATNSILAQVKSSSVSNNANFCSVNSPNCGGIACWSGANAILFKDPMEIFDAQQVLGVCQISALGFAIIGNSPLGTVGMFSMSVTGGNNTNTAQSRTLPQKQQFQDIPLNIASGSLSSPRLFMIVDFTGDILTVN